VEVSTGVFEYVARLALREAGIVLREGKEYLVSSRLAPIAAECGAGSLEDLVRILERPNSRALVSRVIDALTTNETLFFRDVQPFDALKRRVLPALMAARARERTLRIWSAACSTGQEPYSIAMSLDADVPELRGWSLEILGTDISATALEQARAGLYSQTEVNRGMPVACLARYFTQEERSWRLKKSIRDMVQLREMNLIKPWPALPQMDVIFMRNVLIYFDDESKLGVFKNLRRVLKPDGYLFLGGAETPFAHEDVFERVNLPRAGCFQLKSREPGSNGAAAAGDVNAAAAPHAVRMADVE